MGIQRTGESTLIQLEISGAACQFLIENEDSALIPTDPTSVER